jgi:hypothetical protein
VLLVEATSSRIGLEDPEPDRDVPFLDIVASTASWKLEASPLPQVAGDVPKCSSSPGRVAAKPVMTPTSSVVM